MEKTLKELAEEKLEWIQKGFPKDPCRNCMFEDDDGCNCQDIIMKEHLQQRPWKI